MSTPHNLGPTATFTPGLAWGTLGLQPARCLRVSQGMWEFKHCLSWLHKLIYIKKHKATSHKKAQVEQKQGAGWLKVHFVALHGM